MDTYVCNGCKYKMKSETPVMDCPDCKIDYMYSITSSTMYQGVCRCGWKGRKTYNLGYAYHTHHMHNEKTEHNAETIEIKKVGK